MDNVDYFYWEPYFDKDKIGNYIADTLFGVSDSLIRIQDIIQRGTGERVENALMTYVIKRYIDVYSDKMDNLDYLNYIELYKYNIPENYIRKAQMKLIQDIIDWANSGDYEKWQQSKNMFIDLYLLAKRFNKTLLYRFTKAFGSRVLMPELQDILAKKKTQIG